METSYVIEGKRVINVSVKVQYKITEMSQRNIRVQPFVEEITTAVSMATKIPRISNCTTTGLTDNYRVAIK